MHKFLITVTFLLVSLSAFAAAESFPLFAPPLEALVNEALANNPDLKAARERWQMYEHKVLPAQSLDDPRLSLSFSSYPVDSFQSDETNMTGNDLRIEQSFPFPGKLDAKGKAAQQQALWYKGVYEDARMQLAMQVKDTWYNLYYQDRAIAITLKNIALLDDFTHLTATRYEVGAGLQQDVLKAQIESSKLTERLLTLRQQRISLLVEFNRLLARQSTSPLKLPEKIEIQEVTTDVTRLQEEASTHRPLFASYSSLIDQYQAQKNLAELDYYPDFNVFVGYRVRDNNLPDGGTDYLSAGVSINLPIWREKRGAQVAEASSGIHMARRQYDNFRAQVFANIHDVHAQLEKNHTLVDLFESGILPQAQQTFEASLMAYQVGDVDFLSLLDSLLTLYRYEIDYYRSVSDYQRSIAGLEAISGVALKK
ncbi:MAG: TolC family protein [Desulfuromonadaceae bacterium]|nr:TolC family protein [Desulfuromonadaceae bacterium]